MLKTLVNEDTITQELWAMPKDVGPDNYVVVSRVIAKDHQGWETMIFPSDSEGNISSYMDLYVTLDYESTQHSIQTYVNKVFYRSEQNYA
jgi:hypothetical protein